MFMPQENQLPAGREAQFALAAQLFDPEKGGLLTPDDLKEISGQIGTKVQSVMAGTDPAEAVEEDPRLARYKADYAKWDVGMKAKVTWETVQERLTANEGEKLKLAEAMHEGGVMFGVDTAGKILFADGGEDVTDIKETTGLNYPKTREAVHFRNDVKGRKVSTGYEMFPYKEPCEKSPEILVFEQFTGKPFVKSPNGDEWRSSWLESGETPDWPRRAYFNPDYQAVRVDNVVPRNGGPLRGVRRLLRV